MSSNYALLPNYSSNDDQPEEEEDMLFWINDEDLIFPEMQQQQQQQLQDDQQQNSSLLLLQQQQQQQANGDQIISNSSSSTRTSSKQVFPTYTEFPRNDGTDSSAAANKFIFKTKSELDVLDDGYKWRKYGKKMVKSSPYPRNYYHCSYEGCCVKRRVERDREDSSYVVTTYEGVHNHPVPSTSTST